MKNYAISREFFPFNRFTPPISEKFLAMAVPHMKEPRCLWRDPELNVSCHAVVSYDGAKIHCLLLAPKGGTMHGFDIVTNAPTTRAAMAQRIAFMKHMI